MMDMSDISAKASALKGVAGDLDISPGSSPGGETAIAARAVEEAIRDIEADFRGAASNLRSMVSMLTRRIAYMRKFDEPYPSTFATAADAKRVAASLSDKYLKDGYLTEEEMAALRARHNDAEVLAAFFKGMLDHADAYRNSLPGTGYGSKELLGLLNTAAAGGLLDKSIDREAMSKILDPSFSLQGLQAYLDGAEGYTERVHNQLAAALFSSALRDPLNGYSNREEVLLNILKHPAVMDLAAHDIAVEKWLFDDSRNSGFNFTSGKVVAELLKQWNNPPTIEKLRTLIRGVNGTDLDDADRHLKGSASFRRTNSEVADALAMLALGYFATTGKNGLTHDLLADVSRNDRWPQGSGLAKTSAVAGALSAQEVMRFLLNMKRLDGGSEEARRRVNELLAGSLAYPDPSTAAGRTTTIALHGLLHAVLSKQTEKDRRTDEMAIADWLSAAQKDRNKLLKVMGNLEKIGYKSISKVPGLNIATSVSDIAIKAYVERAKKLAEMHALLSRNADKQEQFGNTMKYLDSLHLTEQEYNDLQEFYEWLSGTTGAANQAES